MKVHHSSTIDFKKLSQENHKQETAVASEKAAPAKKEEPEPEVQAATGEAEETVEEGEVEEENLDAQVEEFEFPITLEDGTTETLAVSTKDDILEKVSNFCGIFMTANKQGCIDQLVPVITERVKSEAD